MIEIFTGGLPLKSDPSTIPSKFILICLYIRLDLYRNLSNNVIVVNHSFIEISNFYTMTVYEKGAEVVRMLNTLLGDDAFYAGAKLYFNRLSFTAIQKNKQAQLFISQRTVVYYLASRILSEQTY